MPATRPRPLDRTSPLPLWAQLHQDLLRRLRTGAFEHSFPAEHDLVEQYAVSRHTVREALRRLRDDGLIASGPGRPTTVRHDRIEQPLGALYSLYREIEARGMRQHNEVLAQSITVDDTVAERLGLAPGSELFHLERLRLADEEPLAHDRVWLPADVARPLLEADFTRAALYDELGSRCGIQLTGGRERISAITVDERQGRRLRLAPGAACLLVERIGLRQRRPLESRITIMRGDRYSVTSEWNRRGYHLGASGPPD